MIKLRLTFGEKAVPGFLTKENPHQFVELYELFGFPEHVTFWAPASLPEDVINPFEAAFREKGKQVKRVRVAVPVISDLASLTPILGRLEPGTSLSDQSIILFGGERLFNVVDYLFSLLKSRPHIFHLPTTLSAQAEFPFLQHSFLFDGAVPNRFKPQGVFREMVWVDVHTLQFLPEPAYQMGLLTLVRLATLLDRQLFVFLEENVPQLLSRDSDTLLQVLYKIYQIKKSVLFPTEFHQILERFFTEPLISFCGVLGTQCPDFSPRQLYLWDILWRWHYSLEIGKGDAMDFRRLRALLKSLKLSVRVSPEIESCLKRVTDFPGEALPKEVVLPRAFGKVTLQVDFDRALFRQSLEAVGRIFTKA
ncbi:MAG: 3-dehydroquinate synthase [Calditrichaeota bacterium]|nr:3-dehydroquinate synthase [Calditrichota bacterium]